MENHKVTLDLNYILSQMNQIYTEHSIQQEQNTHSRQAPMEHSPEYSAFKAVTISNLYISILNIKESFR